MAWCYTRACGRYAGVAKASVRHNLQAWRHVAVIRMCNLKSGFQHAKLGETAAAYAGCKLATLTPAMRGCVLEAAARGFLMKLEPNSIMLDPVPGEKCDGTRRAVNQAEYDWLHDGRRVQCKSAQLSWRATSNSWLACFRHIKPELLDELLLVLYVPGQLLFFRHDCKTGLSSNGRTTAATGSFMYVYAPKQMQSISSAQACIISKLRSSPSCTFLGGLDTCSELVCQLLQTSASSEKMRLEQEAFHCHPLQLEHPPSVRGILVQNIVQEVDSILHPYTSVKGERKDSPYDWCRDDLRVECKHSRMAWNRRRWVCRFSRVKQAHFDILYLALDSPAGLLVVEFRGAKFLTGTGISQEVNGKNIEISAPIGKVQWSEAVATMMQKLVVAGSVHVATVVW